MSQQKFSDKTLTGIAGGLSFAEYDLEITRLEAKARRQDEAYRRTMRLIDSLRDLQQRAEP